MEPPGRPSDPLLLLLVLGTALGFGGLQRLLRRLARTLPRILPTHLPTHLQRDPLRTWRWHNLLVSLAHSLCSGLWALLCVWQTPEMLVDIEMASSPSGYLLVCFSTGYFIHDTMDIVVSRQARASWEYLLHHVLAMGAFFSGIFKGRFVAGGVLTLWVEVSNIFLTLRMMMKLNNAQGHPLYRIIKYANLVVYFLFRLAPQAYLTWYFLRYAGERTLGTFLMVILLLLDLMILTYFSRLLRSDFCPQRARGRPGKESDKFLTD
ncbi:TLC domain-containing protein 1 [Tachyglossus aculeatus]|uniref:TLC domain-containing protein 1 n=1 Tax=Tachyglossus aculeatus TaxID=9261 RepID=UPI0018F587CF|nr:TLC domain-containing protein 1 [Tachyglossus aculeatus]